MQAKKIFLLIATLMGVNISTVYGSSYQQCCYDTSPLGSGWFVGIYGAFDTFYINSKDLVTINDGRKFYRYEEIHRAPGGGGYLGWGCGFCDRFSLTFQFAGTGYASSAQHIIQDDDSGENYHNEVRIKYSFDLSLLPGVLIGDCLLLYAKIGASVIGIRQNYSVADDDPPYEIFNKASMNDTSWGVVFGSGAQVAISRCFSAFTEFVWHSYPTHSSILIAPADEDIDTSLQSHLTRIFGFGFRGGLGWTF